VRPGGRNGEWLWWSGGTVLAAAVLMLCYLRIAKSVPVLSDAASNALQAWDMLHGNLLLTGWVGSDVSFWTTELPRYLLVEAFVGLRPEVVHICSALTYTLLVLLAAYVARGRASGAAGAGRALLAAVIMLAPEPGSGTFVVLGEPDHVGSAVPVLLVLLVLDWGARRWWVPAVTGLLLTWGLVADHLVLIVGVLPLVTICLARAGLAVRRSRQTVRDVGYELGLAASAAIAMIAARVIVAVVQDSGGLVVSRMTGANGPALNGAILLDVRNLLSLFGADPGGMPFLFLQGPGGLPEYTPGRIAQSFAVIHLAGAVLVVTAVVAVGRRLIRWLRQPDGGPADLVSDVLVVAIVFNVAMFFLAYHAINMWLAEEAGPVLALGAALAGRQFGGLAARITLTRTRGAAAASRLVIVSLVAGYCAMLGYAVAQPPQAPAANVALAQWLVAHGLHSGIAGYWEANSVTLDSDGQVTMRSLFPDPDGPVSWQAWETDNRLHDPSKYSANFLVAAPVDLPAAAQAIRTFGPPAVSYRYLSYTILVWHKNLLAEVRPAGPNRQS
jgi:hypothetical protein